MAEGKWFIMLEGVGKVDPGGEADEIQELLKAFIIKLVTEGHTVRTKEIRKAI